MENPWKYLPDEFPFLLPSDYHSVMAFNKEVKSVHKIRYELLPEPYLGNPDAPIYLLNLNPGFSELDIPFYEKEYVQTTWKKNILHCHMDYPFYLLDPEIQEESGPMWWTKKLKEPIQFAGRKKVANTFFCVEYFPYHSKNYRANKFVLESQRYGFHLVKQAIAKGAIFILMRAEKLWVEAIPELRNYQFLYRLNSSQNVSISQANCPTGFELIKEHLKE